jgi:SAM-dependent methyltransferase
MSPTNPEEEKVRDFYDRFGWVRKAGVSGEEALFRDFSPPYYPYHERVNARTMDCIADLAGRLLIAGGGDLPETHITLAGRFSQTTCLDISKVAIEIARSKLGERAECIVGSILDIPKPQNHFDVVYCAHVIYHIDRDHQSKAVRELIRVTRPGGRVIVIYANPESVPVRIARVKEKLPLLRKLKRARPHGRPDARSQPPLYYFAHSLSWWSQFEGQCEVRMKPWDVMGNVQEQTILINDAIASFGYRLCSWFENRFPDTAARWWSYPLVVLTKKPTNTASIAPPSNG